MGAISCNQFIKTNERELRGETRCTSKPSTSCSLSRSSSGSQPASDTHHISLIPSTLKLLLRCFVDDEDEEDGSLEDEDDPVRCSFLGITFKKRMRLWLSSLKNGFKCSG